MKFYSHPILLAFAVWGIDTCGVDCFQILVTSTRTRIPLLHKQQQRHDRFLCSSPTKVHNSLATDDSLTATNPHDNETVATSKQLSSPDLDGAVPPASLVRPPSELQSLKVGETYVPIPNAPLAITRVALQPDIFVLRNLLPFEEDRQVLVEYPKKFGMEYAETKSGQQVHRKNSFISWITPHVHNGGEPEEDNHNNLDDHNHHDNNMLASTAQQISHHMAQLNSFLFLNNNEDDWFDAEDLQVVRYTSGGKFDLHHDGFSRTVTVLTYLNGVAGTWFPFALTNDEELQNDETVPPQMTLEGKDMTHGKKPGQDGIWVIGSEQHDDTTTNKEYSENEHTIRINPGDSLVFYNYEWFDDDTTHHHPSSTNSITSGGDSGDNAVGIVDNTPNKDDTVRMGGGTLMNWRSIHAGMPTDREKWIATNWFRSDRVTEYLLIRPGSR